MSARTDGFRCAAPPVADKVRQPKVEKRDRDQRGGRANRDERVANAICKMVARTDAAQLIDGGRQPRQWRNNKYSKPQNTEMPSGLNDGVAPMKADKQGEDRKSRCTGQNRLLQSRSASEEADRSVQATQRKVESPLVERACAYSFAGLAR